jgi:hypothetical protein
VSHESTESTGDDATSAGQAQVPFLRVVRGEPNPEELAALVTVLAAASSGGTEDSDAGDPSTWADRSHGLRQMLPHGPGAWRASVLPR